MRTCESCGGPIARKSSRRSRKWLETARFCSRACRGNGARVKPAAERFWDLVDMTAGPDGCWPWTGAIGWNGYGRFNDGERTVTASRYAYEITHGPIGSPRIFVCHRCDNPRCCNPAHLFLGTPDENERDMREKGRDRKAVGERAPTAKLTEDEVRAIRGAYAAGGVSQSELARRYGVRSGTLRNVVLGISWRHVCD